MDTLAHGLWGGAAFGQKEKGQWKWAFFWGMAPDLFSFGPFFLTHLPYIYHRFTTPGHSGPPDPHMIPMYVYHAYNVTHSLVVWAVAAVLFYRIKRRFPWVFGAWALHILCDIPLHGIRFFPTPYLWPFPTPFIDGHPWARTQFMAWNYGLMALAYLSIYLYKSTQPKRA